MLAPCLHHAKNIRTHQGFSSFLEGLGGMFAPCLQHACTVLAQCLHHVKILVVPGRHLSGEFSPICQESWGNSNVRLLAASDFYKYVPQLKNVYVSDVYYSRSPLPFDPPFRFTSIFLCHFHLSPLPFTSHFHVMSIIHVTIYFPLPLFNIELSTLLWMRSRYLFELSSL